MRQRVWTILFRTSTAELLVPHPLLTNSLPAAPEVKGPSSTALPATPLALMELKNMRRVHVPVGLDNIHMQDMRVEGGKDLKANTFWQRQQPQNPFWDITPFWESETEEPVFEFICPEILETVTVGCVLEGPST